MKHGERGVSRTSHQRAWVLVGQLLCVLCCIVQLDGQLIAARPQQVADWQAVLPALAGCRSVCASPDQTYNGLMNAMTTA